MATSQRTRIARMEAKGDNPKHSSPFAGPRSCMD